MDVKLNFKGGGSFIELRPQFSHNAEIIYVAWKNQILGYVTKTGHLCAEFIGIKDLIIGFSVHFYDSQECITACSKSGEVITWKSVTRFKINNKKIVSNNIQNFCIVSAEDDQLQAVFSYKHKKTNKITFCLYDIFKNTIQDIKFSIKNDDCDYFFDVSCNKYFVVAQKFSLVIIRLDNPSILYRHNMANDKIFTCLSCHPNDDIILTGDQTGRVVVWQNIFHNKAIQTVFHWHNLSVRCVSFSSYGSTFYSGGEECVLVRWQLDNKLEKNFLPRLTSCIRQITISPNNLYTAVATEDNAIKIIGPKNDPISLIQHLVIGNQLDTGIVVDLKTKAIVMNGSTGHIQFYSPSDKSLLYSVDIVCANRLTHEREYNLENTLVKKIAISKSGHWLATVEERQDVIYFGEIRLKFWNFDASIQNFRLNTSVEYPHESSVHNIMFQPGSDKSLLLCVTVGSDHKFKVWRLEDSSIYKQGSLWGFLCSGFYRNLNCKSAAFTIDGSLLAVSFNQIITTWVPENCELKCSLVHPNYKQEINDIRFGIQNCCHLLVATSEENIHVWNILTLTMIWTVALKVSYLIADSITTNMAVFTKQNEVFVFTPNSPIPVFSSNKLLNKHSVVAAAFVPSKFSNDVRMKWYQRSPILFINQDRELYLIGTKDETADTALSIEDEHSLFSQTLPQKQASKIDVMEPTQLMFSKDIWQKNIAKYLDAPIHTMIPIHILCGSLLKTLVLQKSN